MAAVLLTLLLHLPHASGPGDHAIPETAFPVDDIGKSIVLYDVVECSAEELWMTFEGTAGAPLFVQLGVPVLPRLDGYQPAIAVLAPGLPEIVDGQFPFEVPPGLGAMELDTAGPRGDFYEPFTGTSSWILAEETISLPADGTGFIVAWTPDRSTGKQWVSVGTVEDFSQGIPIPLEEVQQFHEIGEFAPEDEIFEMVCEDPPGPEEPTDSSDAGGETGDAAGFDPMGAGGCACDASDEAPGSAALFGLMVLAGLRRRR